MVQFVNKSYQLNTGTTSDFKMGVIRCEMKEFEIKGCLSQPSVQKFEIIPAPGLHN